MEQELVLLAATAAAIAFTHTILGPDHYVPFIAMSKARGWSAMRTACITIVCGIGHVVASVGIGIIGIALGTMVFRLEAIEAVRGDMAGWGLFAFGVAYFLWGVRRALHEGEHGHRHDARSSRNLTPWILFTLFVLGPCEPLIPLILYPAAQADMTAVLFVSLSFAVATIATMLGCVMISRYGLSKIRLPELSRYTHAMAGLALVFCGGSITFLGW